MNRLILVTGHSGGGKTTIMRQLMQNEIVSFTTREKRPGEVDGIDYIFIPLEKYEEMDANGQLAEKTKYADNFYGLTKDEIETKLSEGDAFCIVDSHGMKQLKQLYNNVSTIFIHTSKEDARKQMEHRGESEAIISKRLSTYEAEMKNRGLYDYVVKNNHGKIEQTIKIVQDILEAEVSFKNGR